MACTMKWLKNGVHEYERNSHLNICKCTLFPICSGEIKHRILYVEIENIKSVTHSSATKFTKKDPYLILMGKELIIYSTSQWLGHYNGVIMTAMASQITSLTIVYSTVYSGADQRIHQSSASLAFVPGIYRWPVNSPHKGPVRRKRFPLVDVIMDFIMLSIVTRRCYLWPSDLQSPVPEQAHTWQDIKSLIWKTCYCSYVVFLIFLLFRAASSFRAQWFVYS